MDFQTEKKGYNRSEVDRYVEQYERETRKIQDDQIDRIRTLRKELDETKAKLDEMLKREKLISNTLVVAVARAEEIEREAKNKYEKEMTDIAAFHEKWKRYYERLTACYPVDDTLEKVGKVNDAMERILKDIAPLPSPESSESSMFSAPIMSETRPEKAQDAPSGLRKDNSEEEAQYDAESARLEGAHGINMHAVTNALSEAINEDDRFERIASGWARGIAPKEVSAYLDAADPSGTAPRIPVDSRTGVNPAALRSRSGTNGFSFDEALSPKESLGDIMADLGLGGDSGDKK